MPFDVPHVDVVRFTFFFLFLGRATHFCTAGWHAAWVNRKKPGSKDRRDNEMYLTNVTAYQVCLWMWRLFHKNALKMLDLLCGRGLTRKGNHWVTLKRTIQQSHPPEHKNKRLRRWLPAERKKRKTQQSPTSQPPTYPHHKCTSPSPLYPPSSPLTPKCLVLTNRCTKSGVMM